MIAAALWGAGISSTVEARGVIAVVPPAAC